MNQLHSFEEVTAALLAYSPPGMKGKYQLERIRQLLDYLGNPQDNLKVIHIAGTSGKTSTAYFVRGLLQAAGQRTGLTVSPHIKAINERVQIDGTPLPPARFLAYVNQFLETVAKTNLQPTYFELLIALAYSVFAQEKVDYAVIETGLGGLLDGTNVVSRPDKVCVITDIGLDHTEILGDTVAKIAFQKAGIIQPHNHVILRQQNSEIMDVIANRVEKQKATLEVVKNEQADDNLPKFQHRNWALATAVFDYVRIRDGLPKPTNAELTAVTRQTPPGRWEVYNYEDKTIILDGAHNPQKIEALCDSLKRYGVTSCAALANLSEAPEEKITAVLKLLKPFVSHLIIPQFSAGQDLKSRHSVTPDHIERYARMLGYSSIEQQTELPRAVKLLLQRPEKVLLITGSLYLVSAVRPLVEKLTNTHH